MANEGLKDLIEKRCRRAIAVTLGVKEREVDHYLPPAVQARLRKEILDQFNDLASLAIDVLESVEGDFVLNELYRNKIDDILDKVS